GVLSFYYGGPSHLDTFDPKPGAPAEVRGAYGTIATSVPGVRVCEHLPRTASLMHKLALVRGVHHPMRNHNSAAAEALTGRTPAGGDQELLTDDPRGLPTLGSAVSYALGPRAHTLPYVALPYTIYNVVPLPGQILFLARRLVERGVNFVTVFDGQTNGQEANWDSHENLFARHRQLIPPRDQSFSALVEDLDARGLLDSTLVVALGEFGRTPKVNGNRGRDHWPDCFSVVLAGGGVTGGAVYGASHRIGAYPAADGVTTGDLAATLF